AATPDAPPADEIKPAAVIPPWRARATAVVEAQPAPPVPPIPPAAPVAPGWRRLPVPPSVISGPLPIQPMAPAPIYLQPPRPMRLPHLQSPAPQQSGQVDYWLAVLTGYWQQLTQW